MHDQPRAAVHELRREALVVLQLRDPTAKTTAVAELDTRQGAGTLSIDRNAVLPVSTQPGAPDRPPLVPPHQVPRRKLGTDSGRAALIHALAHIEFNAINLALDAVTRFSGMPEAYYADWFSVAVEEAYHFKLLIEHLATLGSACGDFPAHNGLWEVAHKTSDDPLARMALVPRILEARGLDVTPGLQARLQQAGDQAAADILSIILRDEVGHVRIGNYWYHWLCAERGLAPDRYFEQLRQAYGMAPPHPPFNESARLAAGFTAAELERWTDEAER